jgi:hypothetical protein
MSKLNKAIGLALGILSVALGGCAKLPQAGDEKIAAELYRQSIMDAAVVSPAKVTPLLPLPAAEQVSVISWVTDNRIPCTGTNSCDYVTGDYRVWVTLSGEVQEQCRQWHLRGDALRARLEQLLGLPPGSPVQYRKTAFVAMLVPAKSLQRACLGVDDSNLQQPVCTLDVRASTPAELQQFVMQQMAGSYLVDNPQAPGYPFTRLGYTYDWNPQAVTKKHYGASEFLLAPKSAVKVLAITTTDDYCN